MDIKNWDLQIDDEFLNIIKSEYKTKNITPNYENIFKVFNLINQKDVNVIILGQDPYPTEGDANGIAFSVNRNYKLPPSLKNIFKELENDLNIIRTEGDLTNIVQQGVLFLNTVLTTEVSKPKSHSKIGWQKYTNEVITKLSENKNKIFVLLGNDAQKYEKIINNKHNIILKTSHPSPLSAYRGFLGSNIFSQINNELIKLNKKPIKW